MSSQRCEGCGRSVSLAGGIANVWTFSGSHTGGMTLELADGTEHFLCFDCIDELGDDPAAADVEALPRRPRDEPVTTGASDDSGVANVGLGLVAGGVLGAVVGVAVGGELEPWLATGAALGIGLAVLADRLAGGE